MSIPNDPLINHIVVVMLENRSYDNVLGQLSQENTPLPPRADLNGLKTMECNPAPTEPANSFGGKICTEAATSGIVPQNDPGELFCDMMQQLLGDTSLPKTNRWKLLSANPTMHGYVYNYASLTTGFLDKKPLVPVAQWGDCMAYFQECQVPVTTWLARNFAVCDQWFSSAPCQTYTNRCFSICAAPAVAVPAAFGKPYSLVNDIDYFFYSPISPLRLGHLQETGTIFEALDTAYPANSSQCYYSGEVPNWKVYFHDYSITGQISNYVANAGTQPASGTNVNLSTYDNSNWPGSLRPSLLGSHRSLRNATTTFLEDLANGTLPKLSIIEPRYSNNCSNGSKSSPNIIGLPPNSNHPGKAYLPFPFPQPEHGPHIDVADGEAFLCDVYSKLRESSIWDTTLLIVTYDEPGGMYDHVPPPSISKPLVITSTGQVIPPAKSPGFLLCSEDPSADGFTYNRFGGRVPTIVISPLIASGSRVSVDENSTPFDHTSIIRTVWECFLGSHCPNPPGVNSLTSRDAAAPSLLEFLKSSNNTGAISVDCPPTTSPLSELLVDDLENEFEAFIKLKAGRLFRNE